MEHEKRLYVVVIAVGVLALVLSTCLGAFAGGMVGFWAARKVGSDITDEYRRAFEEQWERIQREELWLGPPERLPSMPDTGGAMVTEVVEGGPAARADVRPGDVIIAVDGVRIDEETTLSEVIGRYQPGDRVELVLWRGGRELAAMVGLTEHPDKQGAAYLGVYYQMLPARIRPPTTD
ncbi:MAG: hypothetical protein AMJ93_00875 [Anaerolineae bacterium SM23_84]|nr:MAG: hypothetical protein AMJ93_00875 [Anaerolineae bacterium SM23_84]